MHSIAVIGASLAGLEAAVTLRRAGFNGRLVIVGEERHQPYDRPPLSKQLLSGEWTVDRVRLEVDETGLAAEWQLGRRATGFEAATRRVEFDDGEREAFDGVVIATGATPRPLAGAMRGGVHVLRTLDDCVSLAADLASRPERVAIIGDGFIGAEVAATCRGLGLQVTVIEALAVPLERVLGNQVGRMIGEFQREQGVDLRLGATVRELHGGARVVALGLGDGTIVDADVVVVAVGVAPATTWLEGSGLRLHDGVVCNESCLAAPGVVAAGDVARWPNVRFGETNRIEHWDNAVRMGRHAALRLLAEDAESHEPYAPIPWFWSDLYGRKLQFVGSAASFDEFTVVSGSLAERRFVGLYRRGERLIAAVGMNSAREILRYRQLLGESRGWETALADGHPAGAPAWHEVL